MKLTNLFSRRVLGLIISTLLLASFVFAAAFFFNSKVFAQVSEVDATFNPAVTKDVTSNVTGNLTLQPDGKILTFGVFESGGTYLDRLNTDGTADATFSCSVCDVINTAGGISVLALADGKIIVTGRTAVSIYNIFRLNSDGSLDGAFNPIISQGIGTIFEVDVVAAQPDGKILVKQGSFGLGATFREIFRYNTDGSKDTSFTTIVAGPSFTERTGYSRVLVLANGKIIVGGSVSNSNPAERGFIIRYNSNGTLDTTFEPPLLADSNDNRSSVSYFDAYPDGSIIVSGKFATVNGINKTDLVRLLPAGNVDLNFTSDPLFTQTFTYGGRFSILPNGQLLVSTIVYNFVNQMTFPNRTYRFNSNGTLDNTFSIPAELTQSSLMTLDSSNRGLVFGVLSGITRFLRLNTNGSLDTSFNSTLVKNGIVNTIAVQTDGKSLIAGDFSRVNGTVKNNFARVNSDGTPDASFDAGTGFNVAPTVITVQTDGKILAIGGFATYNGTAKARIARLNSNGSLDTSFNPEFDSNLSTIVSLANGQILVGGNFSTVNGINRTYLARLNSNGSLDTSFSPLFSLGYVSSVIIQADGKIMVGGGFDGVNGFNRSNCVRLNADGSLDLSFNTNNAVAAVIKIIQQSDGKFLLQQRFFITRQNNSGSADTSFQRIELSSNPSISVFNTIYLQSDGKVLSGGLFFTPRANLARYLSDGTLDSVFLPAGTNNTVNAIVGQPDGKILVGGNFGTIGNASRSGFARITVSAIQNTTDFDFDGDGKADVSVFRPSENKWYILQSSDGQVVQIIFATGGDIPTPADFDGDGKTDVAIFRPSAGDWWSLSSINNAAVLTHWGQNGDIPRPSDFDGDGRTDFVIYRPAENNWYRYGSTGQVSTKNFGSPGDKPVIGDFDGDGKSDVAIFRPSTGDWWYQSSVDNSQRATHWGISTDVPAAADFDGDGKTDFAVYRPTTGTWYISGSSTGSATVVNFGIAEDKPVAADYDGDGKADIAVYRPSTGIWYLLRSTSGFAALQFGISSDVPVPYSFVP